MKETACSHEHNKPSSSVDEGSLQVAVAILAAMADVERLKILLLLSENTELCVSEIAQCSDDKANTISMRLKKLYDAGLLSKRRQEKHIYYRLKDDHVIDMISNAVAHAQHG